MAWFFLILGGVFESLFSLSLGKISESQGREAVLWFVGFVFFVSLSMFFLYKAIDSGLGIGLSYAVWAAIGVAGSVMLGILFFNEPAGAWRIFFLTTLIASVVGLHFVSGV
jgi:quaternary ammonium compound-resistance protein SugE